MTGGRSTCNAMGGSPGNLDLLFFLWGGGAFGGFSNWALCCDFVIAFHYFNRSEFQIAPLSRNRQQH